MKQIDNPDVSIIVPVYNVENYLNDCISSLVEQKFKSIEIILVDDGSGDNSGKMCDDWSKKDSRIMVIHKENGGLSSARNLGINKAKGEYIAFVDSDDYVDVSFIEKLYNASTMYDADLVMCEYIAIDKKVDFLPATEGEVVEMTSTEAIHNMCCVPYSTKFNVAWNKLYKKKLFEDIRFPEGKNHEDEFVTYKVILSAKKIASVSEYLYYYIKRNNSITDVESFQSRKNVIEAFEMRCNYLNSLGYMEEYYATLRTINYLKEKYGGATSKIKNSENNLIQNHSIKVNDWVSKKKLNQKIVIFGAGEVGIQLYHSLMKEGYTDISIIDNRWYVDSLKELEVEPLYTVCNCVVDTLIIAIKDKESQKKIAKLLMTWGIEKSCIKNVTCEV